jgi:hypothetical protein
VGSSSPGPATRARSFDVPAAADLDPVVALALIVLEGRPDRMGKPPLGTAT